MDPDTPELLTPAQVRKILGVSDSTLWRLRRTGALTPHIITEGGHARYTPEQVEALRRGRWVK